MLNNFVKPSNSGFKKKIVNGKLQVEYDSDIQNSSKPRNQRIYSNHAQPISFNNNGLYRDKPINDNSQNNNKIGNKLYYNQNNINNEINNDNNNNENRSFLKKWQKQSPNTNERQNYHQRNNYSNIQFKDNDPANNLILMPQVQKNKSHLDSNHTLRSPYHQLRTSNQNSVQSVRSRTADTLNRRFIDNQYKPVHMYTRFQPSLSKYEHDMVRSRLSNSKGGSLDKNPSNLRDMQDYAFKRFNTDKGNMYSPNQNERYNIDKRFNKNLNGIYQKIPELNNIHSFSNLKPQINDNHSEKFQQQERSKNPLYRQRNMDINGQKAYTHYPSHPDNNSHHPRNFNINHNNYMNINRPSSVVRSHQNFSNQRGRSIGYQNKNNRFRVPKANGRSNILSMFFRKILVFNSKLEGLKQKLFAPNSGFDCQKLFKDFARENPEHLSMKELMSLFKSLDFNYSPQIVYKILLYLIRQEPLLLNPLNNISPSKKFELTGSGKLLEVLTNRIQSISQNTQKKRFKNPHSPNSDHLEYSKFQAFFCPMKEAESVVSDETLERSLHGARGFDSSLNKEAIFHLVRQIVILSLRKLEDLGWVIRSLRLFPPEHLFQLLGPELVQNRKKSNHLNNNFTSINKNGNNNAKQMKNSLTFQNIPEHNNNNEKNNRSELLNKFLTPKKTTPLEIVNEFSLQKFLKLNGVDFLSGDLIFIFKELGFYNDKVGFDQFSGYITADLWSL